MEMEVVRVSNEAIAHAARIIRRGGVVVYPTDTAYALGGLYDDKKVIARILKIKGRQDTKFTLIAASRYQVENFYKLSAKEKKLANTHWPGPLSLVVSPHFSIRVPANHTAKTLARRAGKPLIATSANVTGRPAVYTIEAFERQFKNHKELPDLVLDAGALQVKKLSTVVKVYQDKIEIIRKGAIEI